MITQVTEIHSKNHGLLTGNIRLWFLWVSMILTQRIITFAIFCHIILVGFLCTFEHIKTLIVKLYLILVVLQLDVFF